jgi:hypothetical protein
MIWILHFYHFNYSRGIGTNSATMVSLYIFFRPTLTRVEIDSDNLGRQFRAGLVSSTEASIQKLTLRNKYVLVRNNQPTPAANVGKCMEINSIVTIVRSISKEFWIGVLLLINGAENSTRFGKRMSLLRQEIIFSPRFICLFVCLFIYLHNNRWV